MYGRKEFVKSTQAHRRQPELSIGRVHFHNILNKQAPCAILTIHVSFMYIFQLVCSWEDISRLALENVAGQV
jgi:hypothetical protein